MGIDSLTYAAYYGRRGTVELLLNERRRREVEEGTVVNADAEHLALANFALPALMVASIRGEKDVMRVLLRAGVSLTMAQSMEEGHSNGGKTTQNESGVKGFMAQLEALTVFRAKAEKMAGFVNRAELKFFRLHTF